MGLISSGVVIFHTGASAADSGHFRRKEGFGDAHPTQHATQDTTQGATKLNPAPYPTHSMFTPVGRLVS